MGTFPTRAAVSVVIAVLIWSLSSVGAAEVVQVGLLFSDAEKDETMLVIENAGKIDPLRPISLVSRDGSYREQHAIRHFVDNRFVHLKEPLQKSFYSGARLYQVE